MDNPYDTDGDGLIEVHTVEQLNVIRYDLNGNGEIDDTTSYDSTVDDSKAAAYVAAFHGACPPDEDSYRGYELAAALTFAGTRWMRDAMAEGIADAVVEGWEPIGDLALQYTAIFEGNGHTITGLCINRPDTDYIALFGYAGASAIIRNVFLEEVEVSGSNYVGGLAGFNTGYITSSYATGTVDGNAYVGGLVGSNGGSGAITSSYATSAVMSTGFYVGGLVGSNGGSGAITSSYATGSVRGTDRVGGLVGGGTNFSSTITASYATGDVTGDTRVGGLVAQSSHSITSSYYSSVAVVLQGGAAAPDQYARSLVKLASVPTADTPGIFGRGIGQ